MKASKTCHEMGNYLKSHHTEEDGATSSFHDPNHTACAHGPGRLRVTTMEHGAL